MRNIPIPDESIIITKFPLNLLLLFNWISCQSNWSEYLDFYKTTLLSGQYLCGRPVRSREIISKLATLQFPTSNDPPEHNITTLSWPSFCPRVGAPKGIPGPATHDTRWAMFLLKYLAFSRLYPRVLNSNYTYTHHISSVLTGTIIDSEVL